MKKSDTLQLNKELLKFYKSAKTEFKKVKMVDVDGQVLDREFNGLCAFLIDKSEDFFKKDIETQYKKVENAILKKKSTINNIKKYKNKNLIWFPTNEIRLNFIDSQINKYQKLVDKQKTI
jgi:hypothetical protein